MPEIGSNEQATLELIASSGEHTVVDGRALRDLEDKGLVEMSAEGWNVTELGRMMVETVDETN